MGAAKRADARRRLSRSATHPHNYTLLNRQDPCNESFVPLMFLSVSGGVGRESGDSDGHAPVLTVREIEVVELVVDGLTNQQIADRLGVTRRTAQLHVANSMRKVAVHSRTQLAVFALRSGIVPLHPRHAGSSDSRRPASDTSG